MKVDGQSGLKWQRRRLVLIAAPILLILTWHWIVLLGSPFGQAKEIGSVAPFREDLCPSGDGTRVVFSRATEKGIGLFFLNTADGRPRILCEQRERGFSWQRFGMLGWSPDDRYFLCAFPTGKRLNEGQCREKLLVCGGVTGRKWIEIETDPDITEAAWLTPESFACITYNQDITVYQRKSDVSWVRVRAFPGAAPGRLDSRHSSFMAVSPDALAWSNRGALWRLDLNSTVAEEVLPVTNHPNGFNRNPAPIYAPPPARDQSSAAVDAFTGSGRFLYTLRTQWAEGPGLWQFDTQTQQARCVLRGTKLRRPLTTPQTVVLTNTNGRPITCHVWAPVEDGRKHPLILAQAPHVWNPYAQVAVHEGYCLAMVERRCWDDPAVKEWGMDVLALYHALADKAGIDTNRVFLLSSSWESTFLADLLQTQPRLWAGAILIDPGTLPTRYPARLLVIAGDGDTEEVRRLRTFQADACSRGMPLRLLLQRGVQHVPRSLATERERSVCFARFLRENFAAIH